MTFKITRTTATALLLLAGASGLAGCTSPGVPVNRSLESVNQPVVTRTNFTLDLATAPGGGLALSEQRRLDEWFEAMDLRYGDRISIDDPTASRANRVAIEAIAGKYGLLIAEGAPTTAGYVNAGGIRVVLTRSSATVKGCPDWGMKTDTNLNNATAGGYGCAINGNLAAMVANPEDLVTGQKGNGETRVMSSDKAINTYRGQANTGAGGLKASATSGGN